MTFPKKVACIGSGIIGSSWALLFALRDHDVLTYDINEEAIAKSQALVKNMLNNMVHHRIIRRDRVARALDRIRTTTELADASGYDYVQESAIERIDTKVALLRELEDIVGRHVIIASSTSGLSMTVMQKGMRHPGRTVIAHPFNPPHLVPLVEIVRGGRTSSATVEAVSTLMKSLGKVPVHIRKQLPGFAANRLQTAVLRESLAMLAQGVIDADGLEKIMSAGLGLRWAFMGPLVTANLAGGAGGLEYYLDHFGPLTESICKTLSTWTSVPVSVKQKAMRQTRELPLIKERSYGDLVRWRDENLIGVLKERGYL